MSRQRWMVGGALGLLLSLVGTSVGQPPVRVERRDERRDDRHDVRRVKQILGSQVSIRGGHQVGTVEDIVLADDGTVDYLVAHSEGKNVLVPWEAARFDAGRRVISVEIAPERFREVPTFTTEQWPNVYEPAYREKLYGFYGLKPRAERRIERRNGIPP